MRCLHNAHVACLQVNNSPTLGVLTATSPDAQPVAASSPFTLRATGFTNTNTLPVPSRPLLYQFFYTPSGPPPALSQSQLPPSQQQSSFSASLYGAIALNEPSPNPVLSVAGLPRGPAGEAGWMLPLSVRVVDASGAVAWASAAVRVAQQADPASTAAQTLSNL